ncbi:MAG: HAD family hydrolase [Candidatus Latescibacteria bacterium]|jgi:phosphoglycolate phosphatase|nr:HAD family hydrolase [Candidatus Latescibacterota bacterium]MBT4136670.1 HAD family hydrolase [Candidatus Latescibacterota bacterium]MBT5832769.1 HAD family hydrolase [Candidatus Latescibacterota bacterium]
MLKKLPKTIEQVSTTLKQNAYRSVVFDFDGTISLIRQGWREIMIPMMVEILSETKTAETDTELETLVADYVDHLTGKQTIYQMIQLCEEIAKRGGKAKEPLEYKQQFNTLLNNHIKNRIQGLESDALTADDLMVIGTRNLLENLQSRGLVLYLASGTDEAFVRQEAELLGVTPYFEDRIFGAQEQYQSFSKAQVIQNILKTHAINGAELLGFGDGYVEIENVKAVGGTTIGVASDEVNREQLNLWKRERLISVGADIIVPHYTEQEALISHLCD